MKNDSKGVWHLIKAFKYSLDGFKWAVKKESAFRHDIIFYILIILIVALTTNFNPICILAVIATIFLLFITELLNTSIECVVDIVSPEYNTLAKAAKDMCSAAVFLAVLLVLIIAASVIVSYHLQ